MLFCWPIVAFIMLQLGAICYQMIVLNLIWLSRYIQIEVLIAQMLCEFVSFVPKKLLSWNTVGTFGISHHASSLDHFQDVSFLIHAWNIWHKSPCLHFFGPSDNSIFAQTGVVLVWIIQLEWRLLLFNQCFQIYPN